MLHVNIIGMATTHHFTSCFLLTGWDHRSTKLKTETTPQDSRERRSRRILVNCCGCCCSWIFCRSCYPWKIALIENLVVKFATPQKPPLVSSFSCPLLLSTSLCPYCLSMDYVNGVIVSVLLYDLCCICIVIHCVKIYSKYSTCSGSYVSRTDMYRG